MAEHGDQRVDTESIDLASNKVTDPGLRDAKELRGLCLGQATGVDQLAQANHQIGPDLEVRGLFSRKS